MDRRCRWRPRLANQDPLGALKIVIDTETRKVLGLHAALDCAGDVMLAATYPIRAGMTADDVADTWAPYLTMSEALRIAAGAVPHRQADQLLCMSGQPIPATRPAGRHRRRALDVVCSPD